MLLIVQLVAMQNPSQDKAVTFYSGYANLANDETQLWLSPRFSGERAVSALVYAPVALRKRLVTFDLYSILKQVRQVQASNSFTIDSGYFSSSTSIAGFGTLLP